MISYTEFKDILEADKSTEMRYKLSMNVIKRAIGKNYSEDDLAEFIEIEAQKHKFDSAEYAEYVKSNIKK